jgi:hypothetical protein
MIDKHKKPQSKNLVFTLFPLYHFLIWWRSTEVFRRASLLLVGVLRLGLEKLRKEIEEFY